MILHPKPSPRHHGTPAGLAVAAAAAPVPGWLRRAVPDAQSLAGHGVEDIAITAGAATSALDHVVRREEKWAGAWRQRLALAAAAVTARQAGRIEDEAALRDAVLLTKPGDDVGPAGRLLLAWRRLAATPAEKLLTEAGIGAVLDDFGLARDDRRVSELTVGLHQLVASGGTVAMLTGAIAAAERYGFGRPLGAFIADALLAQRLGWIHAVPLLGAEVIAGLGAPRPRRSGTGIAAASIEIDPERAKSLLAAQARAALRAIDVSAELARRAERLLAVAPKLRAKGADTVVQKLLSGDAMVASDPVAGMSDRALRRLFDRLVDLGAVRELSRRPTFRIYGL
ncbi:MAG: DUF1403 family protein [Hyphomicrobiales bacterium]|uniref:DUF1403 family protein n=1 Tax=Mesorhizobium sp. GR13 TaxID=2562308 RepID=UPI0010BFE27B|nr:DUF1403 family protein [Mesorhizobium sp. GR13]MCC2095741.1 DUF1403 family protein [Hyphomicrobiales bacterium]